LKKVVYIVSNIDKAFAFEWIAENLNLCKFQLTFIILNNKIPYLQEYLKNKRVTTFYIPYSGKRDFVKVFLKIYKLIKQLKPDIVHTHLFDANLIGLGAAYLYGVPKRIYTRHHSTFHHEYFPKAVKYDRLTNYFSTDIVAISRIVEVTLLHKENVAPNKIHLIQHGFDLKKFETKIQNDSDTLKKKYSLKDNMHPVIGVISRYFELKGIPYIIAAFKELLKQYPNAYLILANSVGPDKAVIQQLLESLPESSYSEISFEPNLFALYHLFDIFVHVPIDPEIEAFGQIYIEALAAGVPSIFTLSGVAHEFIAHENNALVVGYKDSEEIYLSMLRILQDEHLRLKLIHNGKESVLKFNLSAYIGALENLYSA
jgi:glycosyltransferase involved in cell wall biosynthesis